MMRDIVHACITTREGVSARTLRLIQRVNVELLNACATLGDDVESLRRSSREDPSR